MSNIYITNYDSGKQDLIKSRYRELLRDKDILLPYNFQQILRIIMTPISEFRRILLKWKPGMGKTIMSIILALEYKSIFATINPEFKIAIFGFTQNIFKRELISNPSFGYVTRDEKKYMDELREKILETGDIYAKTKLQDMVSQLKTRLSKDFIFVGYRSLFNKIFTLEGRYQHITKDELQNQIDSKQIFVNEGFIESMKNTIIICDEVPNVYNTSSPNNWGLSLQYLFDKIGKTSKVVLLTATPMFSSAREIVNIVNLLNQPINHIEASDIFIGKTSKLDPKKEPLLRKLVKNKVSFIQDFSPDIFPTFSFTGNHIKPIKYIKFTKLSMSNHQKKYYNKMKETRESLAYISNAVLPNGYYSPKQVQNDENFQQYLDHEKTPNGKWLKTDLKKISSKYYYTLQDIHKSIKNKTGKTFVYHNYVHHSGILLIRNIFKHNGLIEYGTTPNNDTLCFYCAKLKSKHADVDMKKPPKGAITDHSFSPVTFITIYSKYNDNQIMGLLELFNSPQNTDGSQILVILSSRILNEAYSLKAGQRMILTSPVFNFSSMLQIFTRVRRAKSALLLPKSKQHVKFTILVNSPYEIQSFIRIFMEYEDIMVVEKIFHEMAIDGQLNFNIIDNSISNSIIPILRYKKPILSINKDLVDNQSPIYLFFHKDKDMRSIAFTIKNLFIDISPIFTYDELWANTINPPFKTQINTSNINRDLFNICLFLLTHDEHSTYYTTNESNIASLAYSNTFIYDKLLIFHNGFYILADKTLKSGIKNNTKTANFQAPRVSLFKFKIDHSLMLTAKNVSTIVDVKSVLKSGIYHHTPNTIFTVLIEILSKKENPKSPFTKPEQAFISQLTKKGLLDTNYQTSDEKSSSNTHKWGIKIHDRFTIYDRIKNTYKTVEHVDHNKGENPWKIVVEKRKPNSWKTYYIIRNPASKKKNVSDIRKSERGRRCDNLKKPRLNKILKKFNIRVDDDRKKILCNLIRDQFRKQDETTDQRWFYRYYESNIYGI